MGVSSISRGKSSRARSRWWFAVPMALGTACAGNTRGCSSLSPPHNEPAPFGIPAAQRIEGGLQLRLTKSGVAKLGATLDAPFPTVACIPTQMLTSGPLLTVTACDAADCPGNVTGCPVFLYPKAGERPATVTPAPPFPPPPANKDDGKDHSSYTVASDATGPFISGSVTFDALSPIHVTVTSSIPGGGNCYLYGYDAHTADDSADPLDAVARIDLGVDAATGALMASLGDFQVNGPVSVTGCGSLGSVINAYIGSLQTTLEGQIKDAIEPQVNAALQAALPKPPGVAGTIVFPPELSPYAPPSNVDLEFMSVLGGYARVAAEGLNLGIISGLNSDADTSTRTPPLVSEPSACVSNASLPNLGGAPWNLVETPRQSFLLLPQAPFDGTADTGFDAGTDVALGISEPFLALAMAHVVNSGALCLSVGGATEPALTTGALSVLVDSTGTAYADRRAPLTAVVHPASQPSVTLGAGTPADPFVHVLFRSLGIDLNLTSTRANVLSSTFDVESTFDLDTSPVVTGRPGIEPILVGTTVSNPSVSIQKGAIVADAARLTGVVESIARAVAEIAAGPYAGPVPLPSVGSIGLDGIAIANAASQNNAAFLQITGTIAPPAPDTAVQTTASLVATSVPDEPHLRALFDPTPAPSAPRPNVTLALGPANAEFSIRVDGSAWRPWSADANPTVTDDALLLQGAHGIDVRARAPGKWKTEDLSPVHLAFVIDSVPPEIHPKIAGKPSSAGGTQTVVFNGFDLVTADNKLVYAWNDTTGSRTAFTAVSTMPVSNALSITNGGATPLVLFAKDEVGNIGQTSFDLEGALAAANGGGAAQDGGSGRDAGGTGADASNGKRDGGGTGEANGGSDSGADASHSRGAASSGDSSGCGCRVGATSSSSGLMALECLVLLAFRRQRRPERPITRRRGPSHPRRGAPRRQG